MEPIHLIWIPVICVGVWAWMSRRALLGRNDREFIDRIMDDTKGHKIQVQLSKSRFCCYLLCGVFVLTGLCAASVDDFLGVRFKLGLALVCLVSAIADDVKIKMLLLARKMGKMNLEDTSVVGQGEEQP